jgi:hypothetical protein
MSLSPSDNYSGASYLGNIKENWLFQLFNQDSYLSLDGTDDVVDLGATTSASPLSITSTGDSGTGVSLCGMVNFPTLGTGEWIFANTTQDANWAGINVFKTAENKLSILWGDGSEDDSDDYERIQVKTATFSADTWTFFAIVTNFSTDVSESTIYLGTGSTLTAYTGSSGLSGAGSGSNTTPTYGSGNAHIGKLILGDDSYGQFKIKNLGIYASQLDSANVTALFNSGNFLSFEENTGNYDEASNLKGYWEFNNGENFAQDLSGNVATGTITGAKYEGFLPLALRDTTVDNIFYHGVVSSMPSVRNSIDVLKSTSKTGNMSLSLINAKYKGSDLSTELFLGSNYYYNRTVKAYSQLSEISNIDDCLQLYHGRLTNINHDDSSISLSLVQKSPWDNKVIPTVKSTRGNYFPIVYGNYTKNASTHDSTSYVGTLNKLLFPVKVDNTNTYYNCLLHKDIGSTDTQLHYYEEGMDAFLPLEDVSNAIAQGDGHAVKTKWNLKRHIKFKPVGVVARSLSSVANIIDGDANHTISDGVNSIDMAKASDGVSTNIHKDNLFSLPLVSDPPDILSGSNNHGLKVEVRWNMTGFKGTTAHSGGLSSNSITIYDQSQYATGSIPNTANVGTQFATNGTFNGSLTSGTSVTIAEVTSATTGSVTANSFHTYPWDNGLSIRFRRLVTSSTDGDGDPSSTIAGTLNVADVRLTGTFRIHDYADRVNEIEELYLGADGLTASWDSGAITLGHDAHRDLLIRHAGMPTIEPENWSTLEADRATWNIRYWLHKEQSLINILEKLQYEFGFIHKISPDGKSKYVWIHGTGTNNALRAEDVVATLTKKDISSLKISTTPVNQIMTKAIINTLKHPAKDTYLAEATAINATPRATYNIKSKENTSTINLDALTLAPATTPATDKQADFYSYYSQANGDVKKVVECEIINPQKGYLLETGDVIKFDDMTVEPFADDWANYYIIVSLTRKPSKISIKAREIG